MFTKYSIIYFVLILFFASCSKKYKKSVVVVYPDHCGGCVSRNFSAINHNRLKDELEIYFDTTTAFVLNEAKKNNLNYIHIAGKDIAAKFGDYANILIINTEGKATELNTDQTLEKGKQF